MIKPLGSHSFFPQSAQHIHHINQVTWVGLFINILLSFLKFILGIIGNSAAVVADAVHSLSDLLTDVMILIGVKFWTKPADSSHPYGHLRIESLITVFLGLVLAGSAVLICYSALTSIGSKKFIQPSLIALIGPLLSIVFKEALYQWTKFVAKKVQSNALLANAWHHRSDAFSSIPVVLAVALASYFPNLAYLDSVGAIIVGIFILKISWDIIWPRLSELTDISATQKECRKIEAITAAIPGVQSLHALRTRKHGSAIYADLHVLVAPDMSVKDGHDIASVVKRTLIAKLPHLIDVVVHIEPDDEDDISQIKKI